MQKTNGDRPQFYRTFLRLVTAWIMSVGVLALATEGLMAQTVGAPGPERVVERFLTRADYGGQIATGVANEWVELRTVPAIVPVLIQISEDGRWPGIVRRNALLRLGNTSQQRAYAYLRELLARLAPDDELRETVVLALGNGHLDPPEFVYPLLEESLHRENDMERRSAIMALSDIGSSRAIELLRTRVPRERDPGLRIRLQRALGSARP